MWRFNLNGIESLIHDYWRVDVADCTATINHKQAHILRAANGLRWSSTGLNKLQI